MHEEVWISAGVKLKLRCSWIQPYHVGLINTTTQQTSQPPALAIDPSPRSAAGTGQSIDRIHHTQHAWPASTATGTARCFVRAASLISPASSPTPPLCVVDDSKKHRRPAALRSIEIQCQHALPLDAWMASPQSAQSNRSITPIGRDEGATGALRFFVPLCHRRLLLWRNRGYWTYGVCQERRRQARCLRTKKRDRSTEVFVGWNIQAITNLNPS